ncbi:hypothetical protein J4H86_18530 [Spiractinospora alimapuensis]|uniref:hypothetical protein n=1 Tax=Spiractinospora alimapuensis TaxID=2820884 RepID=UPI001F245A12|nr:hypothetical protein [Spiractinospora alimapuensis]QVQ50846.1 hypothetical protein J4H86_18530 [Spiractinospora alimapuensis]
MSATPEPPALVPVATFCGKCDCGCPQLWIDPAAEPEKRVVLTDDFGQRIQMSADQLADLVEQARTGAFEGVAGR